MAANLDPPGGPSPGPLLGAEPVQHVPSEGVSRGDARVVEVLVRRVLEADPAHHGARRLVGDRGERDDLVQAEGREAVLENGPGRLGRVAVSPGTPPQPPADL